MNSLLFGIAFIVAGMAWLVLNYFAEMMSNVQSTAREKLKPVLFGVGMVGFGFVLIFVG